MFGNLFSGWHVVILVALVLLLFGATKLPALAKSLGESIRILRKETTKPGDARPDGDDRGDGGDARGGGSDSASDGSQDSPPQRD
jgi:sec-independent protein translocase protein TatA